MAERRDKPPRRRPADQQLTMLGGPLRSEHRRPAEGSDWSNLEPGEVLAGEEYQPSWIAEVLLRHEARKFGWEEADAADRLREAASGLLLFTIRREADHVVYGLEIL